MRFNGRVRFPDDETADLDIAVEVSESHVRLLSGHESLGSWCLADVVANRIVANEFQIDLGGEIITFVAEDQVNFAYGAVQGMAEGWARYHAMNPVSRKRAVAAARRRNEPSRLQDARRVFVAAGSRLLETPEPETAEPEETPTEAGDGMTLRRRRRREAKPAVADALVADPVDVEPEIEVPAPSEPAPSAPEPERVEAAPVPHPEPTPIEVTPIEAEPIEAPEPEPVWVAAPTEEKPAESLPQGKMAGRLPRLDAFPTRTQDEPAPEVPSPDVAEVEHEPPPATEVNVDDAHLLHRRPRRRHHDAVGPPAQAPAPEAPAPEEPAPEEPAPEEPAPEPGWVVPVDPGSDLTEAPLPARPVGRATWQSPDSEDSPAAVTAEPRPTLPAFKDGRHPAETSGLRASVRSIFGRGNAEHEHAFVESTTAVGLTRRVCLECGYVSIGVAD